jgi:isoleucyl-tRNA synthetase
MEAYCMDYKESLNLPKTGFPMRANLVKKEPEMIEKWDREGLYHLIRESSKGRKPYMLHDGPPYANGHIHMGTAFNKILKDIIIKSRQMAGFNSPYVPGWDCHGLPIEHRVDSDPS